MYVVWNTEKEQYYGSEDLWTGDINEAFIFHSLENARGITESFPWCEVFNIKIDLVGVVDGNNES